TGGGFSYVGLLSTGVGSLTIRNNATATCLGFLDVAQAEGTGTVSVETGGHLTCDWLSLGSGNGILSVTGTGSGVTANNMDWGDALFGGATITVGAGASLIQPAGQTT